MESCKTQRILAIKFHQIQWNLLGRMGFPRQNLIKHNGILWDPGDFSNQISSSPMESYGIHGNPSVLIIENLKKYFPNVSPCPPLIITRVPLINQPPMSLMLFLWIWPFINPVCTPTWGTVLEKNQSKIMTPNVQHPINLPLWYPSKKIFPGCLRW